MLAWESKIADEDGFGARTTHYVYEPGSFVPVAQAVRDDAIELLDQPEYGDYYRQDEDPLWSPPPSAPPINSLAWYQCDHLGTPQELRDEHSEIAWSAEYRAWGVAQEAIRKASGKAQFANPIRFQGQYHDSESGLHYNRYRHYDPEVARYISLDPIGLRGGLNLYAYVQCNPVTRVDPLGLQARGPVLLGMGHLYRADAMPPRPALAQRPQAQLLLNDISNNPIPADVLPGVWPGVNIPVEVPKFYCSAGYYGDDPLSDLRPTDDSGLTCKARPKHYDQSYSVFGDNSRKFTCTSLGGL
ncbi:RHS repeat-associated core domain-containing protein [Burkholderia contaminans]|uniref:RHS repeat-associated core domain-containing protein n=1 Tax=Burkholderia contaminans TaxID=488447 RepID=UPI003CC6C5A5